MEQKDKELLLKDICGRLPYDIKCKIEIWIGCDVCTIYNINSIGYVEIVEDSDTNGISIEKIKPYLYPLSSMTEEQKREYEDTLVYHDYTKGGWTIAKTFNDGYVIPYWFVDFCNKNHLDYRGLIPKGLAIDCTNLNIY